ncbi:MAG TPA: hypothetical protein PKE53_04105 [Flavobacteriales bacterium]|nr:CotH kinase family protein [Flavobacteriales bacterium]MCC6656468.1 CotH kinase family protein [Flavobacteriales bacterium]HMU13161.1 hypothetical protein [Flavobacteriales bacterium]HNI03106.1 hypothetical protein [Flavobacteriales bacterium]
MRSKRKKGSTPVALLTGLGLPLLALFGVFSLIPYERMTDRWPLGITGEEVHAYQRWFDQRPDTMPKVDVPRLELSANGDCDGAREFTLPDHPGSVTLEKDGEERILSFPATSPWNDQHTVRLVPADMSAIKRLYAAEVVRRLGVPSGKAGLVRLSVCGDDQGLFLVLEGVDQDFVEAHGASGDVVFGTRTPVDPLVRREADHALNELTALGELWRIDGRSAAVLGMVQAAYGALDPGTASFEPRSGRYRPLFGAHANDTASDPGSRALAWYLGTADAQQRIGALADSLLRDSADIERALAELDARNASAFTGEMRIGYVRAELSHVRQEFLQRLFNQAPRTVTSKAGLPGPQGRVLPSGLDPFLRKYLVGDTIRVPRAKHLIDHVITVPKGYGLVLEKGARLNMTAGSGIIVHGALHARGTQLNPVFIRPADEGAPWAGIHVTGTGSTRCVLTGLRMSGGGASIGGEGAVNAMLAFQGCEVRMSGCAINGSGAGAAIDVHHGKLSMKETWLAGGQVPQLNITFADLEAEGCTFVGEGCPTGVLARGARITLSDLSFSGYSGTALDLALRSHVQAVRVGFTGNGKDKSMDATSTWESGGSAVLIQ